ncbi:MAG: hypothetical protein JNL81_05900 [Hyphomonadaceae bacterium]|nr:hypothetical protein [Hyphomonadaceae bacterium]
MSQRSIVSLICFASAGAWPSVYAALESALMSPLQAALRDSICGAPAHGAIALLGHCPACWVGSAMLILAGLAALVTSGRPAVMQIQTPA